MKHVSIVWGMMLILILNGSVKSQYLSYTPKTDSLIHLGIEQIHRLKLDSSLSTFDKLIQIYPKHPMGYFYKAAVYDVFNQNYRITAYEEEFEKYIDQAIEKGDKYIKKNKNDVLGYFYLGGSYGFRGLHRVYKRDWLHVFIDGYKGLKNLKKSIELRSDFYDVYFGLGLYHYWRSAKTKALYFLPLISDQRQQGINELKLAIKKGRYVQVESRLSLESIYFNEEEYDSAKIMNDWLYERFPKDPSVLYMRSRIYEKKEDWQDLLRTVQELLIVLQNYPHKSVGYQIECHYLKAMAYYNLEQYNHAISNLHTAMGLKESRNEDKELEGPIDDYDQILDNIEKLYKEINEKAGTPQ